MIVEYDCSKTNGHYGPVPEEGMLNIGTKPHAGDGKPPERYADEEEGKHSMDKTSIVPPQHDDRQGNAYSAGSEGRE